MHDWVNLECSGVYRFSHILQAHARGAVNGCVGAIFASNAVVVYMKKATVTSLKLQGKLW